MSFKKIVGVVIAGALIAGSVCGCSTKNTAVKSNDNASSSVNTTDVVSNMREADITKFDYFYIDDKTASVMGYSGEPADIYNIPDSYEGRTIVAIEGECFKLKEMVEVNIPDTVETIGDTTFASCPKLEKVIMGKNVKKIGEHLFFLSPNLKEVKLSDALKEIPYAAFSSCTSLEKITLPNGLERICMLAFFECTNLKEIHIPATVTEIDNGEGDPVFDGCDKLTIYAPSGSYAEQYAKENNIPFVAER